MKRLSTLLLSGVVAFGLVLATGCDSSGSADGESGTLQVTMSGSSTKALLSSAKTQHPTAGDITEALVTIGEVAIVPAEDTSDGDSTEVGVQTLNEENFEIDLKDLQAGVDTAMSEVDIPADTYSQIRLITTGKAQITFDDGSEEDVMIASGQQTGLKLNFEPFTIDSADDRVVVTVNWDVEETLRGSPSGQYVITPAVNDVSVDTSSAS